jgi:hypothetical protein
MKCGFNVKSSKLHLGIFIDNYHLQNKAPGLTEMPIIEIDILLIFELSLLLPEFKNLVKQCSFHSKPYLSNW